MTGFRFAGAVIVGLGLVVGLVFPASAEILWVNESGEFPFTDIQDAVDTASSGDVILVFPGTYGPVEIDDIDLVLRAVEPSAPATILGDGGAALWITEQVTSASLVHGFVVSGGSGIFEDTIQLVAGGGILVNRGAEVRISGNVIEGNSAEVGGGIAVVDALPWIDGNLLVGNGATDAGGGVWIRNATVAGDVHLSCNEVLGNTGGSVAGVFIGDATVFAHNNILDGNSGERGGLWVGAVAQGEFTNNTVVANESLAGSAAGIETESASFDVSNNIVAFNSVGWGAIRSSDLPAWSYNVVWSNTAGDYAGAASDPTGLDGNLTWEPEFALFTPLDPSDDDLTLDSGSPLLDLGDPDPAANDLDGSRNAVGFEGGPQLYCDPDSDGVSALDGDCRPSEAAFHPHAYEQALGLDLDCDGWANFGVVDLVLDDGALSEDGSGVWSFVEPLALPGRGHQGLSAWTTAEGMGVQAGSEATLEWSADLTGLPGTVSAQLALVHAWELGASEVAHLEVFEPVGATWDSLSSWSGSSSSWTVSEVDISGYAGSMVELRFRIQAVAEAVPGWSIGRLELAVVDGDGDGRGAALTDCDDSDPLTYVDAMEIPYDGVDQDCDGSDLEDVDGDGYLAVEVGGDDCDDSASDAFPGGTEVAYDGIDQDCDGSDLTDADGDGHNAVVVGGDDCDDTRSDSYPGAVEVPYDGVDQDCDGDDLVDVDGDGVPGNVAPPFGDCDDENPDTHPGAPEICDDQIDNNCDGAIDHVMDGDGDGFDLCEGDCDDEDPEVRPGVEEVCDGVDTNCDGLVLEGEEDLDLDGVPPCAGDCDDLEALSYPGATEVCDGLDNNCDGGVDEGHDEDLDGFSSCTSDCDDRLSGVYPGAAIVCDSNVDHDCDGRRDFEQDECQPGGCSLVSPRRGHGFSVLFLALALLLRRRTDSGSGSAIP